ncbi:alcohol dehydrogenase catalytic domain-containing protein [Streptomyces sp. NBC_00386]
MPQHVRGVVARAKGGPVRVETIVVPDPGPGEAVVKVQACGVCHTDLHYREGGINDDFPFLLGHEAAGIVESVGTDVRDPAPGDAGAPSPATPTTLVTHALEAHRATRPPSCGARVTTSAVGSTACTGPRGWPRPSCSSGWRCVSRPCGAR